MTNPYNLCSLAKVMQKDHFPCIFWIQSRLSFAIVIPGTENPLSDGADVAGIAKTFLAIDASNG